MRSTAAILCALAVLAACGDDAPDDADLSTVRIEIVSGDSQVVRLGTTTSGDAAPLASVEVGSDGYTNVPLRVRAVDDGGSASTVPTGVSAAVVPAGTPVHWHTTQGTLFGTTTETDGNAESVNRWKPGTLAGPVEVSAGRIVGDSIVIDTVFRFEQLPGPPVDGWAFNSIHYGGRDTLTVNGNPPITDEHGNEYGWKFGASCCAHALSMSADSGYYSQTLVADSVGTGTFQVYTPAAPGDSLLVEGTLTVAEDTTAPGHLEITIEREPGP